MAPIDPTPPDQPPSTTPNHRVAAIFGVSGLVGNELLRQLTASTNPAWTKIYGISRKPDKIFSSPTPKNYQFISCDLLDPLDTNKKLSCLTDMTHIFWVTWAHDYPLDSIECCDQNKAMISNAIDAILAKDKAHFLKHFSLQTGMKHYVSLQKTQKNRVEFYTENEPRSNWGCNFYYVLEDLLKERLFKHKISWSVHRPGLVTGCSTRTLFNFMGSICVYGSICGFLNLPFLFGGSKECWEETYIDLSDSRLVAEQHIWVSTKEELYSLEGEAYNAINGYRFTWKNIWPLIGRKLGVEERETERENWSEFWYGKEMREKGEIWREIVKTKGLKEIEMEELANWEFLDVLFRCPMKLLGSRTKIDEIGFRRRFYVLESIFYWIDFMRDQKLIP